MKRILRYSRHVMRAKGRHGTHSPFVYAFVEQVMRRKAGMTVPEQKFFSKKEVQLLYKTINYLQPQRIYAPAAWLGVLSLITDNSAIQLETLPVADTLPADTHWLVLAPCDALLLQTAPKWLAASTANILVLRPHKDKAARQVWQALQRLPAVSLSLDCWHYGLLVKDPAFKARQHFAIR